MSITFNGTLSDDLGVIVEHIPNPQIAARRGNTEVVPGRNGVLLQDDGSFATVPAEYDMHISAEGGMLFKRAARKTAAWLLSEPGFHRLEDSYEPDVFRLAKYNGGIDITSYFYNHGRFLCSFECQPQRYLKAGEAEISVDASVDAGGICYGTIRVSPIPYGIKAVSAEATEDVYFTGNYRDRYGNEIGQSILETPVPVPDNAVTITCSWSNADEDTGITMYGVDETGEKAPLFGVVGTSPILYNPTVFEAMPLLKFVDTSAEPAPASVTLSLVQNTVIAPNGRIAPAAITGRPDVNCATCSPVQVAGYVNAYVTGSRFAFYKSNGDLLFLSKSSDFTAQKVVIPSGAATIVVEDRGETPDVQLQLQAARPNPGDSAVSINGTTINLDFSEHDTIILDCDLHDAYYLDGSPANDKVTFSSDIDPYPTFPGFIPGANTVLVRDGDNLDFSIFPRWWVL